MSTAGPKWIYSPPLRGPFQGLGLKLSLLCFFLLALITLGSSMVVMEMMERALLSELAKRGMSVSNSIASPAGFSLLASDRLALDNLAGSIGAFQDDLAYVAIVDSRGMVRAHSHLEAAGELFGPQDGVAVFPDRGFDMRRVRRGDQDHYEFRTPILFAGKTVGEVILGIDSSSLRAAKAAARGKILLIAGGALALGIVGTLLLTSFITRPIQNLAEGVRRLREGKYGPVRVTSSDELGQLTRDFNDMAEVIVQQNTSLSEYARNLEESYVSTVKILAAAIDARDEYTLGHSTRVSNLAVLIGRKLGLDQAELNDLAMACFLHDLGKIRISDRILNKRGPLNSEEYEAILRHPEHGAEILGLAESLRKFIPAVLNHHEWYNGEGYPAGLKGDEIPRTAAIIAIADAYDAMVSSRPYRQGLCRTEAMKEIRRFRGTQFAPELVDIFLEVLADYEGGNEFLPVPGVA